MVLGSELLPRCLLRRVAVLVGEGASYECIGVLVGSSFFLQFAGNEIGG